MIVLQGYYYSGQEPIGVPGRIELQADNVNLVAGQISEQFRAEMVKASPRIGRADRFISFPDAAQFQCPDHPILDSLIQISPTERPVAWLEEKWGVALTAVIVVVLFLLAGYFYGLPIAAERIAQRIPVENEQMLGRQAINWLDQRGWFKPTKIDINTQTAIKEGFDKLIDGLPLRKYYQLEFRDSKSFGANAFAFPGGTIVITDEMVKATESPDEVFAVLAHEIGHVELRHTLRSLLQNSAIAVASTAVTSDAASLSTAVATFPVLIAETKYSRNFESAADDFAFKLLKQKGYSPAAFASIMQRLSEKYKQEERAFAYVSTHPVTEERVKLALKADVSLPEATGPSSLKSSYETVNLRNHNEAIRLYSQTITSAELTAEKQAIAYNDRGSLWMSDKGYTNAIADYNEAIRLNPQFEAAFFNRGIAYFHQKNFPLAIADLEQSQRLSKDPYASIWLYLASVKAETSDAKSELAVSSVEITDNWPGPIIMLYLDKSDEASVTAHITSDVKRQKELMCEANFYTGEWHLIKGDKQQAQLLFTKAKDECPTNKLEYGSAISELDRLN